MSDTPQFTDMPTDGVRESLTQLLTDESASEVALYVLRKMAIEADRDTFDYEFTLSSHTGKMNFGSDRNVWFVFDTKPGSKLYDIKKAIYEASNDAECDNFIKRWFWKVCTAMENEHREVAEDSIRQAMFKGKPVPIRLERVTRFEVSDFDMVEEDQNYSLVIEKEVPKTLLDEEGAEGAGSVTAELFKIHAETGKGFNQIIREKKAEGDPKYQYVKSAVTKKLLYEGQIDFMVDFSVPMSGD